MGVRYNIHRDKPPEDVKKAHIVLAFRWLILTVIFLLYFFDSQDTSSKTVFLQTFGVAAVYNAIVTAYRRSKEVSRKGNYLLICIDTMLISVFCYLLKGISSDIYILYYFLIGYCGIYGNPSNTLKISYLTVGSYSLACIFYMKRSPGDFNYIRLLIKDLLVIFAAYGVTLVNQEVKKYDDMHKKEFKLARVDKLTGLANRHYFDQKLKEELMYADDTGSPLNVLMFDLDNFKKFNDAYGHVWGDKLLTLFSDIIRNNIRAADIPVRYGGEEFLILIRDLDIVVARSVGERIRRELEKQKICVDDQEKKIVVTVSCGIAQYPAHSGDIKTIVDYADKALYHAKETGKNRIVSYDEIGSTRY